VNAVGTIEEGEYFVVGRGAEIKKGGVEK